MRLWWEAYHYFFRLNKEWRMSLNTAKVACVNKCQGNIDFFFSCFFGYFDLSFLIPYKKPWENTHIWCKLVRVILISKQRLNAIRGGNSPSLRIILIRKNVPLILLSVSYNTEPMDVPAATSRREMDRSWHDRNSRIDTLVDNSCIGPENK